VLLRSCCNRDRRSIGQIGRVGIRSKRRDTIFIIVSCDREQETVASVVAGASFFKAQTRSSSRPSRFSGQFAAINARSRIPTFSTHRPHTVSSCPPVCILPWHTGSSSSALNGGGGNDDDDVGHVDRENEWATVRASQTI